MVNKEITIKTQSVTVDAVDNKPGGTIWLVGAPWAHPFWDNYFVSVTDLTTEIEGKPAYLKSPEMTHELVVFAMNPDLDVPEDITDDIIDSTIGKYWLSPPNFGYQMEFKNDEEARKWVQENIIVPIEKGHLSPDTDYKKQWDEIMSTINSQTLRKTS